MSQIKSPPAPTSFCHSLIRTTEAIIDSTCPEAGRFLREAVDRGEDPLGDLFCVERSAEERRLLGATYTPSGLVHRMIDFAASLCPRPSRIIDAGAGSGRFTLQAARRFPYAQVIAVEYDTIAADILEANVRMAGMSDRVEIRRADYREIELAPVEGPTLFIGNPPYVRHHDISPEWKAWFSQEAASFGLKASQLSGLHLHFFLQTLRLSKIGDICLFVTAAEWMDTNYGSFLRSCLRGPLGGLSVHVTPPEMRVFDDALTTAAVTACSPWRSSEQIKFGQVDLAWDFSSGNSVLLADLDAKSSWTKHLSDEPLKVAEEDLVELGEYFRVSRGQVTGANKVFIVGNETPPLPPICQVRTVTKAKDLSIEGHVLKCHDQLKEVVELPADLSGFSKGEMAQVNAFLEWARAQGAHESYIARHRKPWWRVGLHDPAPILCTYMGRRPPIFVLNQAKAPMLNIAHGLYPRKKMSQGTLDRVCLWLRENVSVGQGRTYAGGLTKFEPKEVERIRVPRRLFEK